MRNNGWIEFQNVSILCVELIILCRLGSTEICIVGHWVDSLRSAINPPYRKKRARCFLLR